MTDSGGRRERPYVSTVALGLLFASLGTATLLHGGVEQTAVAGVLTLIAASACAWALDCARRGELVIYRGRLDLCAAGFVIAVVGSALGSRLPHASWLEVQRVVGYAVVLFLCTQLIRRRRDVRAVAWSVAGFGGLFATLGLIMSGSELFVLRTFDTGGRRISLTFANPDHFACYLVMVALVTTGLAVGLRGGRRLLVLVLAVYIELAIVLSLSRGGIIALVVGLVVFAVLTLCTAARREAATSIVAVGLLVVVLTGILGSGAVVDRLQTLRDPAAVGAGRLELWRASLALFAERPWLGSGPGTLAQLIGPHLPDRQARRVVRHAHNDFLEIAAELGLAGLLPLIAGLGVIVVTGLRHLVRLDDRTVQSIGFGALSGCVAAMVHGFLDFNFQVPANVLLGLGCGALVLVCADAAWRRRTDPTWITLTLGRRGRALLVAVTVLLAVPAGVSIWRPYAVERALARAQGLASARDYRAAAAELTAVRDLGVGDPRLPAELGRLAFVAQLVGEDAAGREVALTEALRLTDVAIGLCPPCDPLHSQRGRVLNALGRHEEAEVALQRVVELAPTRPRGQLELGRQYLARGAMELARIHLRRAIDLDPATDVPLVVEAVLGSGRGYAAVAAFVPDSAPAQLAFGRHMLAEGDLGLGLDALVRAYELEPTVATAKLHLEALVAHEQWEEVVTAAAEYVARLPVDADLYAPMIAANVALDRVDAAAWLYERLITIEPTDPYHRLGVGRLYRRADRCHQANAALLEAVRLFASGPRAIGSRAGALPLLELAICAERADRTTDAVGYLREAVAIQPDNAQIHYRLGLQLDHLGDRAGARAAYSRCVELDSARSECVRALRE